MCIKGDKLTVFADCVGSVGIMTVPTHMLYAGAIDEAIGFRSSVMIT
jgi:hypothetical protein